MIVANSCLTSSLHLFKALETNNDDHDRACRLDWAVLFLENIYKDHTNISS